MSDLWIPLLRRALMIAVGCSVIVAGGLMVGAATRTPQVSYMASPSAIYLYDVRAGITKALASDLPTLPAGLSWSPDGSKLVFSRLNRNRYDLYLLTPRDGETVILAERQQSPIVAWSPDGLRVAMVDDTADICLQTVATGERDCLDARSSSRALDWSPDGTTIAYMFGRTAYAVDVTTLTTRLLVDSPPLVSAPVWSPDGTRIAFTAEVRSVGSQQIYVASVDGETLQQVTQTETIARQPIWWDDHRLLVVATPATLAETGTPEGIDITIIDLRDGTETTLFRADGTEYNPQIAPNGDWLGYATDVDGFPQIALIRIDNENQPQILAATTSFGFAWR